MVCRASVGVVAGFLLILALWLVVLQDSTRAQLLGILLSSAVIGGTLSGSLHALTGSDHLAALLPLIFGKRWWQGSFYGCLWGFGHGITSGLIGLLSYKMKSYVIHTSELFQVYGYVVDGIVGLTLVIIGVMGIYEASEHESAPGKEASNATEVERVNDDCDTAWRKEPPECGVLELESGGEMEQVTAPTPTPATHAAASSSTAARTILAFATVFANGCILGVSWDGLPSLAPAVVLEGASLRRFLLGYVLGTVATMSFAAGLVSETTCWISRVTNVNVSERLASISSLCAIAIGGLWVVSGLVKFGHGYLHALDSGYDATSMHDLQDGTGVLALSHTHPSVAYAAEAEADTIGNDTFHEHGYGVGWSLALGAGSVLTVVAVIVYATQSELGSLARSFSLSGKPQVYQV